MLFVNFHDHHWPGNLFLVWWLDPHMSSHVHICELQWINMICVAFPFFLLSLIGSPNAMLGVFQALPPLPELYRYDPWAGRGWLELFGTMELQQVAATSENDLWVWGKCHDLFSCKKNSLVACLGSFFASSCWASNQLEFSAPGEISLSHQWSLQCTAGRGNLVSKVWHPLHDSFWKHLLHVFLFSFICSMMFHAFWKSFWGW